MADKNFVVKNGLVVGSTASIAGVEIDPSGASSNQVLKFNGTKFAPAAESDISGTVYTATIGDGTNSSYTITHGFGTRNVVVIIRNASSPYEVINARWEATTTSTITIDFSSAVNSDSIVVSVYSTVTGISALTTKGDLLTRNASELTRLAVGATNGQLLVVDSTTATGLDYKLIRNYRPASGSVIRPASNQGSATPAQSRVTFFPIEIASCTINTMWCTNWTTAAGATIRMGIYNSDSSGFPGTLLIDAGTVDASTTTGYKSIAVNVTLPTGRFWIAGVSQGGTPQVQIQTNTWHYSMGFQRTFPTTEPAYFSSLVGFNPQPLYQDNVTGALPATASPAYSNSITSGHLIGLQIA